MVVNGQDMSLEEHKLYLREKADKMLQTVNKWKRFKQRVIDNDIEVVRGRNRWDTIVIKR